MSVCVHICVHAWCGVCVYVAFAYVLYLFPLLHVTVVRSPAVAVDTSAHSPYSPQADTGT